MSGNPWGISRWSQVTCHPDDLSNDTASAIAAPPARLTGIGADGRGAEGPAEIGGNVDGHADALQPEPLLAGLHQERTAVKQSHWFCFFIGIVFFFFKKDASCEE